MDVSNGDQVPSTMTELETALERQKALLIEECAKREADAKEDIRHLKNVISCRTDDIKELDDAEKMLCGVLEGTSWEEKMAALWEKLERLKDQAKGMKQPGTQVSNSGKEQFLEAIIPRLRAELNAKENEIARSKQAMESRLALMEKNLETVRQASLQEEEEFLRTKEDLMMGIRCMRNGEKEQIKRVRGLAEKKAKMIQDWKDKRIRAEGEILLRGASTEALTEKLAKAKENLQLERTLVSVLECLALSKEAEKHYDRLSAGQLERVIEQLNDNLNGLENHPSASALVKGIGFYENNAEAGIGSGSVPDMSENELDIQNLAKKISNLNDLLDACEGAEASADKITALRKKLDMKMKMLSILKAELAEADEHKVNRRCAHP